jgi:hypothetical protein
MKMTSIFRSETRITVAAVALMFAFACDKAADGAGARSAGAVAGKDAHPMDRDVETLKQAEQVWAKSLTSGDPKLLATIIDAEFSFIGPDGEYEEKGAYLAGYEQLPKLGVRVESVDIDDSKFRVLDNVAIVTGHVLAKLKVQNDAVTENVRFTRVYRRSPKGWQMVAGQGTRIAEQAVAPKK